MRCRLSGISHAHVLTPWRRMSWIGSRYGRFPPAVKRDPDTQDFRKFIEILVSLMCTREQELGYDPSVWRVTYNNEERYIKLMASSTEPSTASRYLTGPGFNPRTVYITEIPEAQEVRWVNNEAEVIGAVKAATLKRRGWTRTEEEIQKIIFKSLDKNVKDQIGYRTFCIPAIQNALENEDFVCVMDGGKQQSKVWIVPCLTHRHHTFRNSWINSRAIYKAPKDRHFQRRPSILGVPNRRSTLNP